MNSMSNFTDAEFVLRHVLTLDDEYSLAYHQLGNALVGLRKFEEAVEVLKLAIDADDEVAKPTVTQQRLESRETLQNI